MPVSKNIPYLNPGVKDFDPNKHLLDIYAPDSVKSTNVLVFIHGGGWLNGSKNLYSKLGENFAARGIIVVINNYRLAPHVNFLKMADDCAAALLWTYKNIEDYGGDKNRIFISGHSAGGHLASLIVLNPEFFNTSHMYNSVKGGILIDAFGLNAKDFLNKHINLYMDQIEYIFTKDPENWRRGTPAAFLKENKIPFLIFTGELTHDIIMQDNQLFSKKLQENNINYSYEILPGKTHIQMISQMENPNNELYEKISAFFKKIF